MSALRDVIARMAVDSEFARHARANPDQVAREHGLTAEEAAKLRGLADAGSGGGPMALGARLSKSGFGTGGLAAAAAEALGDLEDLAGSQPGPPDQDESPFSNIGNRLGSLNGPEVAPLAQPSLQLGDAAGVGDAVQEPPTVPFDAGEGDDPPSGPADEQPSLQDMVDAVHQSGSDLSGILPEGTQDGGGDHGSPGVPLQELEDVVDKLGDLAQLGDGGSPPEGGAPDLGDSLTLPGGFQLVPEVGSGGDPGPEQSGGEMPEVDYPWPDVEMAPDGPPEAGPAEVPQGPAAEQAPQGGGQPAVPPGAATDQPAPAAPAGPAADQPAPVHQPAPAASAPLADQPAAALGAPGGPADPAAPGPVPADVSGVSSQAQSLLPPDSSAPQQPAAGGIGAAGIAMGAAGAAAGGLAGGIGGAIAGRAARKQADGGTSRDDSAPDSGRAD